MKINFDFNSGIDLEKDNNSEIYKICSEAFIRANEKANNLSPWQVSPSSYMINNFLNEYNTTKEIIFNFQVEQKSYDCQNLIIQNTLDPIFDNYTKDKNKKNAYTYSSDLSKQLFSIMIDYIGYIIHDVQKDVNTVYSDGNFSDLENAAGDFSEWKGVPSIFTSRLKNFERDLLMTEYSGKKDDIDNAGMRTLIYGSSKLFYILSNNRLFILSYSPANEQYYNQKIKEVNKAPSFSFFVYKRDAEDFFIENFETIDQLHKNFMQFTYLSDTNQNIVNAMGEASLISQYWYTESVNRILKDHDKELKKSKDSKLLGEYIIRYILAAEIEGVNLIEVYPFDRVFMFNNSIFEEQKNSEELNVFEGLLESKIPHVEIEDKMFLGGSTQYAYEWEREKTGFSLDRFDPSKKKIKEVKANLEDFSLHTNTLWENDYNKDDEAVMNNLLVAMLNGDREYNRSEMLEYKAKYSENGITYFYSSGTDLKEQVPSLYALQEYYLKKLPKDSANGMSENDAEIIFKEGNEDYFKNVKVVLFSYTPDDENSEKGFTLLLVANDDVPKSLMELKSEKDDLYTALKLLVNQHFTIDQKYKEQSIKEQNELIDILTQTKHSIKNSFENFKIDGDINQLKEKILGIIDQDRTQMIEQGRDASLKLFKQDHNSENTTLDNSLGFLQATLTTTEKNEADNDSQRVLSKKFQTSSTHPWDHFAQEIFKLSSKGLEHRIHSIVWENESNSSEKLKLIIDFNELQDFSLEWKESLFNDAIYVMLKNSCEHAMEIESDTKSMKEVFLDIYISSHGENDTLNIELTNETGKICKEIYDHINTQTTIKNNSNKKNSTGIGVVTIRKRLDVTYGLDRANIKFTMVSENKIKSLLYFPIKHIQGDTLFLNADECQKKSNILYLEDSGEYYIPNIAKLKVSKIYMLHDVRFKVSHPYKESNILITDLNIFGESSDVASVSNGVYSIKHYIAANKHGVVIVLSNDINELKNTEFNGYEKIIYEDGISHLSERTIYLCSSKIIDDALQGLISDYQATQNENTDIVKDNYAQIKRKIRKSKISFSSENIYDFSEISTIDTVSIDEVNNILFRASAKKPLSDIKIWLNKKVMINEILGEEEIINCEVPQHFTTKLLLEESKETPINPILKHELEIRNIILIPSGSNESILNSVSQSMSFSLQKKGIFGKISHDILNKMPEFSVYNSTKIEELKQLNNRLRNSFIEYFEDFLEAKETKDYKNIVKDFELFIKEINKLKNEAMNKKIHLGTDIDNIVFIIETMKYLQGGL